MKRRPKPTRRLPPGSTMEPRPNRSSEPRRTRCADAPEPSRGARDLAFHAINAHQKKGKFITDVLAQEASASNLNSDDRRLALELSNGVVRRQATLDSLITPCVSRPRQNIEDALWTLLRIGTYQLVFTSSIPVYAAINETVETARRLGKPGWTGFINGVLRSVSRTMTDEQTGQPGPDSVPLGDGRYRRLNVDRFPDPSIDPVAYYSAAFSFPRWLVDRWAARHSFDELCQIGFWFNSPTPIMLRTNTLRTTRGELLAKLHAAGIEATPGSDSSAIVLQQSARVDTLPGFAEGLFVVQDETAMQAARLLNPQPGIQVLDLCAAPGTKTTHLAELMRNEGKIIAVDVNRERLARIDENAHRLGISIIETVIAAEDGADIPRGPFDAILLDVPCSNTGVLSKRPEARWRLNPQDLVELPAIQTMLLRSALERLKPGGRVVYSTCSIETEENAAVVRSALGDVQLQERLVLEAEQEHIPGQPSDGGYQALLRISQS